MGATKRLAELLTQASAKNSKNTTLAMVRFGNVIGSSGSVLPIFRSQIEAGGPVTVTHPDVTRYFLTIPEAVKLVLKSAEISQGGEVFVLDMGEPQRIVDVARRLIGLYGKKEDDKVWDKNSVKIEFIGLRPGEKLHEELFLGDELRDTEYHQISKAIEPCWTNERMESFFSAIQPLLSARDADSLVKELVKYGLLVNSSERNQAS
jgi:FlaA1/EpsC-like NDP-sugar epimerase